MSIVLVVVSSPNVILVQNPDNLNYCFPIKLCLRFFVFEVSNIKYTGQWRDKTILCNKFSLFFSIYMFRFSHFLFNFCYFSPFICSDFPIFFFNFCIQSQISSHDSGVHDKHKVWYSRADCPSISFVFVI